MFHIDPPIDPPETSSTLKEQEVSTYQLDNEYPDDPEYEIKAMVDVSFVNDSTYVDKVHWIEHWKYGSKVELLPWGKHFDVYESIIIHDIKKGVIEFE